MVQQLVEIRDNVEEIKEINERARLRLKEEYGIQVSKGEGISTIAYWFVKKAIEHLNDNKTEGEDIEITIQDLIKLGITYRESEDAEKDANFTPFVDVLSSDDKVI